MIHLTRLDESAVVVNADLIATIERTPDTMLTLVTGARLLVKESVEAVVALVVDYRRRLAVLPALTPDPVERRTPWTSPP